MKIMNEGERITTQGFEILIPKNCYGILSDETYSKLAEAPGSLFEEEFWKVESACKSSIPSAAAPVVTATFPKKLRREIISDFLESNRNPVFNFLFIEYDCYL